MSDASAPIAALRTSHDRLATLAAGLTTEQIRSRAYPAQWSIAQVLSHLGSGAQIMALSVDATFAGTEAPGREANAPIWDTWNAKAPEAQVADGVESDRALVARFESLDPAQRKDLKFHSFLGLVTAEALVRLRLNEHAVHTWDVAVALDPSATVGPEAVPFILDGLDRIAQFSGKGQGLDTVVRVTVTEPDRSLTLTLGEKVTIEPATAQTEVPAGFATAELRLPAEAFLRLVYGRLDPDHTPSSVSLSGIELDTLRTAFPGF
jgi:uncharacterized protein (TIGR03083 family)